MTNRQTVTQQVVEEFIGDAAPLAAQIGSAEGLTALGGATTQRFQRVTNLSSLRRFLHDYHSHVLIPVELPAICGAWRHASRCEVRELIELDRKFAGEAVLRDFAAASQRVGGTQLKRLRPLRDQRLVQRYLRAVETGDAHAWHTLVYGLILALYSLSLRQGLLNYAQQTTRGFIHSVACRPELNETERQALFNELSSDLPAAVNAALAPPAESPLLH